MFNFPPHSTKLEQNSAEVTLLKDADFLVAFVSTPVKMHSRTVPPGSLHQGVTIFASVKLA
jgi:hypothetical protein